MGALDNTASRASSACFPVGFYWIGSGPSDFNKTYGGWAIDEKFGTQLGQYSVRPRNPLFKLFLVYLFLEEERMLFFLFFLG